jgi:hypothetical protein
MRETEYGIEFTVLEVTLATVLLVVMAIFWLVHP